MQPKQCDTQGYLRKSEVGCWVIMINDEATFMPRDKRYMGRVFYKKMPKRAQTY